MKRVVSLAVGLSILALPLLAAAGPKGVPPAMMKKVLKEKVGLNDQQVEKISQLQYQADREKLDIHHEIQKTRLDLEQHMQADKPSEAKVFAQIDKIGALETRLKKNRVGLMLKIRKLVTPEQWQKMEEMHAKRKMNRRERRVRKRFEGGQGGAGTGGPRGPGPDGF